MFSQGDKDGRGTVRSDSRRGEQPALRRQNIAHADQRPWESVGLFAGPKGAEPSLGSSSKSRNTQSVCSEKRFCSMDVTENSNY